jgi:hypothetical protein
MERLGFNKSFSFLNNESGTIMLSNAIVSGLMVAVLVLFGESVATCYQYLSLQHSLNEGLRAGIIRATDPFDPTREIKGAEQQLARKVTAKGKVLKIAENLNVRNKSAKKSAFVSGSSLDAGNNVEVLVDNTEDEDPTTAANTKWIRITISKRLDFSKVLSLISKDSAVGRNFNFNFSGKAKIQ